MTDRYICPHCGAHDSGRCDFMLDEADFLAGYPFGYENEARAVGCRIMHFHDKREQE